MKDNKLKIGQLKLKSFVTTISAHNNDTVKGGSGYTCGGFCFTYTYPPCKVTR